MGEILKSVGATFNNVVKSTVLLNDINDFAVVNEVYASFFTQNFPARHVQRLVNLAGFLKTCTGRLGDSKWKRILKNFGECLMNSLIESFRMSPHLICLS